MIYILLGYMFLFIHRPFEVWPALGDFHIERVYVLIATVIWLAAPGKRFLPTKQDLAIGLFCLAVLVAWMLSPWSDAGQPVVEDYFKIVVFYVLVTTAVTRTDQLRKLSLGFLIIMAVYMLHSLWEYKNGRHTYRMQIARLIGVDKTLGDPNSFGASIVYALPFVRLFWLTSRDRLVRLFLLGYTGLSGMCVLLTGSRSSLLGLLGWAFIISMQSRRRFRFLAMGTMLAVAAFAALPGDLQTRFETMINPEVGPENARVSGQGRLEGLINGWALLQKFPLTGCGPGAWRPSTGSTIESHNLYGQMMGETGALGIAAFGTMLTTFLIGLRQLRNRARLDPSPDGQFLFQLTTTLTTAVFLMLMEGMFGHNLLRFNWLWYIGFLVIGLQAVSRKAYVFWRQPRMATQLILARPQLSA
jgi:hypothetical protein